MRSFNENRIHTQSSLQRQARAVQMDDWWNTFTEITARAPLVGFILAALLLLSRLPVLPT